MRAPTPGGLYPHHPLWGGFALLVFLVGCGFPHGLAAPPDASADASIDGARPPSPDAAGPADASTDAFVGVARRINIEGIAYTGVDHPGNWAADLGVCPSVSTLAVTDAIAQTDDDVLYQSAAVANHVHCMLGGLPAGTYDVTLLFAELTCSPQPSRVFSIALEGSIVVSSFDLLGETGGCAVAAGPGHPVERTYSTVVSDGVLDIDLEHIDGDPPLLSAVQAVQTGP